MNIAKKLKPILGLKMYVCMHVYKLSFFLSFIIYFLYISKPSLILVNISVSLL